MTLSAILVGPSGEPIQAHQVTLGPGPTGYRLPSLRVEPADRGGGHLLGVRCDVISASTPRLADRVTAAYQLASGARDVMVTGTAVLITPAEIAVETDPGPHTFHGLLYVDYTELDPYTRRPSGRAPSTVPVGLAISLVPAADTRVAPDPGPTAAAGTQAPTAATGTQATTEFAIPRITRPGAVANPARAGGMNPAGGTAPVGGMAPVGGVDPAAPAPQRPPEPARDDDRAPYPGLVAVDFGTSNCSVALWDPRFLMHRPLATAQRTRLSSLLTDLLEQGQGNGGALVDVRDLAQRLGLPATTAAKEIAGRLGTEQPDFPYQVGHALELQWRTLAPAAQRRLAARLQEIYDEVYRVPALDVLRLFTVTFEGAARRTVLPSDVHVLGTEPLEIHVGPKPAGATARFVVHGLKAHLGRADTIDGHPELDTRQVTAATLGFLLDQSQSYIDQAAELESGVVERVAMTYPVVSPPSVRHALAEMVEQWGARRVHRDFDEAVAAALFVLMRDFGGDHAVGMEAFRAQSRPAGDRTWYQNMLVVDIGGGTTDIALLSLVLEDGTPPLPGVPPERQGRYYTLTPQLLGSTGRLQLGGERITLELFHLLRAALADHVLTNGADAVADLEQRVVTMLEPGHDEIGPYRRGRLVAEVMAESPEVAERARKAAAIVVPTRWNEAPASDREHWRSAFQTLWELAESAKHHLGGAAATDFRPTANEVSSLCSDAGVTGLLDGTEGVTVFGAPGSGGREAAGPESTTWIEDVRTAMKITSERFREIAEPIIMEAVTLATAVAADRLGNDRIDRIVLTGQTSQMPLVRTTFVNHFGDRGGAAGSGVAWAPGEIRAEEPEYAKLAVSLGAAWGTHILVSKRPATNRLPQLRDGMTLLDLQVRNLKFFLPFAFQRSGTYGGGVAASDVLIPTREPLTPTGPDGLYVARSDFDQYLGATYFVYRSTFAGPPPLWGEFQYDTYAARWEPDLELNDDFWKNRVKVQLEVTSELDLYVYLCRGEQPHHRVEDGDHGISTAGAVAAGDDGAELRYDVVLDAEIPGSRPGAGHVVFPAGTEFDAVLRIGDAARRAMIRRLPDPPPGGWTLRLRKPGAHDGESVDEALPPVAVPRWEPREEGDWREYAASLDETGQLRVHLADLSYALVGSMRQLQEGRDGDVLRLELPNKALSTDPFLDPFNGLQ